MTNKIFTITRIKPILTIEYLTYGLGRELGKHYIYLKKRKKQWAKKHGPFENEVKARIFVNIIKDEYDAVRAKQKSSSSTKTHS